MTFDGFSATHDDNGNLTTLDADTFTWDVRNRLASLAGSGLSASFAYDPLGRRITKTLNGQPTVYMSDGVNPLQEQAVAGANWTAVTMTGLGVDEIIARGDASGVYYYLPDGLGSTVALTDGAGAIHTQYTYAPFGETIRTGTVSTNPFQFTARENDNTGLYYYRARYYHPVLQRFISEDPIEFAGGDVNLYGYVRNNPTAFIDPLGLWTVSVGATIGGGLFGFGGGGGTFLNIGHDPARNWLAGWSLSVTGSAGGGAVAGFGASVGISVSGSNAKDVSELLGTFYEVGRGGLGRSGLGYFQSPDGMVKGSTFSLSLRSPGYLGASGGASTTSALVQWVQGHSLAIGASAGGSILSIPLSMKQEPRILGNDKSDGASMLSIPVSTPLAGRK